VGVISEFDCPPKGERGWGTADKTAQVTTGQAKWQAGGVHEAGKGGNTLLQREATDTGTEASSINLTMGGGVRGKAEHMA